MTVGRAVAAALTTLVLVGCRDEPFGVRRLNGHRETRATLSIAEARVPAKAHHVLVRGYLSAPHDDRQRLCTKLEEWSCVGPSLVVVGLDVERVAGLEQGCCSIGRWSPHQVAISGTVADGVLYVPPQPTLGNAY